MGAPRLAAVTTGDPALVRRVAGRRRPRAGGRTSAEVFAAEEARADFPSGRYEFKVHWGDAPAEYQAHRLSAQLLDVDRQASKGQQLIHPHHITAVHPTIGAAAMDEFGTTAGAVGDAVPDQLRALFNNPDDVRVQQLPCVLPGLDSLAVHFGAGARTVPHQHNNGQHLVFVEGVGVVADEDGVHVVRAGDVVSNPPNAWHWHGATPDAAATHVTFEAPGDFDLAVERRDWDDSYGPNLGT